MPQFQYTAVNNAGKKLSGVIGAITEGEARKQLNTLGISVLDIKKTLEQLKESPAAKTEQGTNLKKFEFEAFDKTGKKVVGSIPASSRYKAFKRLMDEYKFEVSYIVPFGATEPDKTAARKEGLDVLKAEYEAQLKSEGRQVEAKAEEEVNVEFEQKRKALLQKVDAILEKIKSLMQSYDKDLNPENRAIIQKYIDKLLRIKSSTNLEYIEHTSEELLKKVQGQELFLHKEQMTSQRQKVRMETQKLMTSLHSRPDNKKDVLEDLEDFQNKLDESNIKIFRGLGQFLSQFIPSEEEKALKRRIHVLSKQILTFLRIWITSPKATKAEAMASVKSVREEKHNLKAELRTLVKKRHALTKKTASLGDEQNVTEPLLTEEIAGFLGWLLTFYLAAYFLSHYFFAKIFPGGNPMPGDFNLLQSGMLRYLLISIFLWYVLLSLRIEYLRYKSWATALILPIGIILNTALIFNL